MLILMCIYMEVSSQMVVCSSDFYEIKIQWQRNHDSYNNNFTSSSSYFYYYTYSTGVLNVILSMLPPSQARMDLCVPTKIYIEILIKRLSLLKTTFHR